MGFPTQNALISTIVRADRDISVLVGSPLSMPDMQSAPGVPSVSGVLDILRERIRSVGLEPDYLKATREIKSDSAGYQAGFEFLRNWVSQDAVNEVVIQAVLKSRKDQHDPESNFDEFEKDNEGWYLPVGTKSLGEIIANHSKITGPVLTTNFDPLLSKAISKAGCRPFQTVLTSDGSLDQHRINDPDSRQVVHLHGYWHRSDTLHTPDQLSASRPNLKASLSRLLSKRMLLVVGYGGWDDIFIDALKDLMFDEGNPLDVMWAFFEKDEDIIKKRYKKLLESVEPARIRGRFRIYSGIDCNDFFKELLFELNGNFQEKNISENNIENSEFKKESCETKNPIEVESKDALAFHFDEVELTENDAKYNGELHFKKWDVRPSLSHQAVRVADQMQFLDALKNDRIVNVVADWGMGNDNFIASTLNSEDSGFSGASLYRIDLDNVNDREGFLNSSFEQLGTEIQQFITSTSRQEGKVVFILDGVQLSTNKNLRSEWQKTLSDLIAAFVDFSSNLQVILCSLQELDEVKAAKIHLSALDDADIKSYIKHGGVYQEPLSSNDLDIISRLSGGIPMRLDGVLEKLNFLSIDDLMEYETNSIIDIEDGEDIPTALKRAVYDLKNAETDHQKRSFYLLKVLSVLAYGETLANIKKFDNAKPFYPTHLIELNKLGLVDTISYDHEMPDISTAMDSVANSTKKIQTVSPLVAEYVLSQLDEKDIYKIVLRASDLTFGQSWRNNKIKLSSAAQIHIRQPIKPGPGNPYLLAKKLLRHSIENGIIREVQQAFNISYFYCSKLSEQNRYRDIITVASEILVLAKESSEISKIHELEFLLGNSYRMVGLFDKALVILEKVSEKIDEFAKNEWPRIYITLALLHDSLDDNVEALKFAKKAKEFSNREESIYFQASSLIMNSLEKNNLKGSLVALESEVRKKGGIIAANNIAFDLAKAESEKFKKIDIYDRIIGSSKDQYDIFKAVIYKASCLVALNKEDGLHPHEKRLLNSAYNYFYMQRMSALFNLSHKILWDIFEKRGDQRGLIKLFRYSSLIWRLQGDSIREHEYAKLLSKTDELLREQRTGAPHSRYALVRIRMLIN